MKLLTLFLIFGSIALASCSPKSSSSKPDISIEEFDKEINTITGLIKKLIDEKDPEVAHEISLGIESTFAVSCVPIGTECTQFHNIVTAIIQHTNDRKFTVEEKMQIIKMNYELENTIKKSRESLVASWKKYN